MARKTRNQRKSVPPKANDSRSSWLATYRPVIDQTLFVLAILGVMTTVHLWIQQGRGFDQGCWGFNPPQGEASTFNCEAVVTSDAGKLFGISNVYWGMAFYLLLSALSFAIIRVAEPMVATLKRARGVMIGAGFLYSMQLVNYQFNSIGELCALCLTSAAIATVLFAVTIVDLATSKKAMEAAAESKEAPASAARVYTSIAGVAVLLLVADIIYFNNLEPANAAVTTASETTDQSVQPVADQEGAEECYYNEQLGTVSDFNSLMSSFDPTIGPEESDVVVLEYFDPNCPHCQALHPVMKEVIEKYKDRVQFRYKPFPLRETSVLQIEAMYVAKEQGKFPEMLDAQIDLHETRGLSVDRVRGLAEQIGMDVSMLNTRLRSGLYRQVVLDQRNKAAAIGLNSVPTIIINGRFVASRSAECLGQFIEEAQ